MATHFPTPGQWYQDAGTSDLFEVVAIDEKNATIEIQYSDGDLDEIELEAWGTASYLPAEAPEDGNAAYGFNAEDHWQEDNYNYIHDYANPLEYIEPDLFQGYDEI